MRITAPLSQGPGSRWYGDDTFYGNRKRKRTSSRALTSVSVGRFEPAKTSLKDDEQGVRSSKCRPQVKELSPVFSPVEPNEHSREMMGSISPLDIGSSESKYAFPAEHPRSTFFKQDLGAVVGVSSVWASCQQTPDARETPASRETSASQEPAHRYCMLCSFLFSEMPRTTRVMRPNPEGCGHAFCKGCYDAVIGPTAVVPPRVSACPECTRTGAVEASEAKSSSLVVDAASFARAPQDVDFDALGVAKFSAAFKRAQMTAPELVELVDSARASTDDVVAFLHMELNIAIGSCEWISDKVRLHDVAQHLQRDRKSSEAPQLSLVGGGGSVRC